jgi:hypothetical protein
MEVHVGKEELTMYLFKQAGPGHIYECEHKVQDRLGVRIWELMKNKTREESSAEGQPFLWELEEAQVSSSCLRDLAGEDEAKEAEKYKLVADVQNVLENPKRQRAHLFEVCKIFGFSGWGWTPMMWKLRELLEVEDCTKARKQNRWEFNPATYFVYEFLRLQADHRWDATREGKRDFGMIGKFNGVLLWPEALNYFVEKMEMR